MQGARGFASASASDAEFLLASSSPSLFVFSVSDAPPTDEPEPRVPRLPGWVTCCCCCGCFPSECVVASSLASSALASRVPKPFRRNSASTIAAFVPIVSEEVPRKLSMVSIASPRSSRSNKAPVTPSNTQSSTGYAFLRRLPNHSSMGSTAIAGGATMARSERSDDAAAKTTTFLFESVAPFTFSLVVFKPAAVFEKPIEDLRRTSPRPRHSATRPSHTTRGCVSRLFPSRVLRIS